MLIRKTGANALQLRNSIYIFLQVLQNSLNTHIAMDAANVTSCFTKHLTPEEQVILRHAHSVPSSSRPGQHQLGSFAARNLNPGYCGPQNHDCATGLSWNNLIKYIHMNAIINSSDDMWLLSSPPLWSKAPLLVSTVRIGYIELERRDPLGR
jgi:hypothetical protein